MEKKRVEGEAGKSRNPKGETKPESEGNVSSISILDLGDRSHWPDWIHARALGRHGSPAHRLERTERSILEQHCVCVGRLLTQTGEIIS